MPAVRHLQQGNKGLACTAPLSPNATQPEDTAESHTTQAMAMLPRPDGKGADVLRASKDDVIFQNEAAHLVVLIPR